MMTTDGETVNCRGEVKMDTDYYKLEIFIPEEFLNDLQTTLANEDAGHIGNYDHCLSYSRVKSTWRPLSGTDPYIGTEGEVSCEEELKVEVSVKKENLSRTIDSILRIHPYEEPVINVIPMLLAYGTGKGADR